MLPAMPSRVNNGTDYQPTVEQLQVLQTASEFAYQIWESRTVSCQTFLRSYPLNSTLTRQQIDDLIQDYTLDENYQLADEIKVMSGLRHLRTLLMMRWIWQDALQTISLEQLTDELSEFADGCISFAKDYTYQHLVAKYGEPTFINEQGNIQIDDMAIMAMGKLGAQELNLSSDIDLIFVHQARGETNGNKAKGTRSIDNKRFMTRLGQGIIKLLDNKTADGFVFRVDMRLRPWGDGSDLAIHLSALQKYFTMHGRAWERFAWLKARVVGQIDQPFYEEIQALIKPFVFRYYVDYSAFSALREMKSLIQNQVAQREDLDNIKLGAGGIRDIEFIVQAFQLIYGGRHPQLQIKPCLQAMQVLSELGYLEHSTYEQLQAAYRFLRRLEHAIQAINDQQTQRLPHDEQWQHNLAVTLNFENWHALLDQLNRHRENVNVPFERMVTERQVPDNEDTDLEPEHLDEQIARLKEVLTEENRELLQNFWQSKMVANLSDEARERLDDAYPVIVHALLAHQEQQQLANTALPRLISLLEAICRRSIYLVMIAENPNATIELIPMLSASPWIAKELAQYPVLLDTFLQQRYRHLPDKRELRDILRQQLLRVEPNDEEELLSVLRLFKKNQVLAVAASDVLAERPIMKVSDSLTYIAEVVLEAALERAFAEIVNRYGYPIGQDGDPVTEADCGFAIIGYGKLGGLELSYSSDLDLVFLHKIKEQGMTTGEKSVSGMKFAARLVQKLMNYLNTQTRDGRAYEIDMRLRPSGNAGMMVVSCHAFETYQMDKAWSWEHQALVRARAICGDRRVTARFCDIRRDVLSLPRTLDQVRSEVTSMRIKMQKHLGTNQWQQEAGKFHLKQDAGGIVDIEFLAQFAVLAYSHEYPSLTKWSDNVRIFAEVALLGIWDDQVCQDLTDAYLRIRAATHQLALSEQSLLVDESLWQETRTLVQSQWQHLMGVETDDE
ncbi:MULTISPECIES: bifunctional [glutamate--ammonia ligase]-adenylyl-L-tyrosine phosphorylase/[glutamate--ammonia-ligase] adenylyltransferase [unclassified Psychrobacter]|uniref:bifunctional [glutamate--ammonia ligase]-adenylyl-L-tyrosine phosphorylase/[glutamate--ammonia-ligase] adenylyltransferase n=1 Tax=unclassified Psychrobacter TaxID=196806 RepID=UPI000AA0D251|nr:MULTISPECIES: bifunctional [glutamate--ammonia ligase]-adenylyl-L-tyrosine phosphorylase/[glutamate--ammonia-ligase] adenylyltransferase [unclassified Psychrobacter]PKG66199.1 bifunctional [glutamate--ammonia ligase]-adenylyl-L-tyrosine phosphorylase/[glutamate--ammonia-ligase] adenylyltransferase [Psychrobacter sp. Choline-02u-13]PKH54270.1 bifunctional [glutamate--ammonia ligase]-adenylyl-L-tyrosine phosphorylase/[glutamate--ammonia-ligase] adenylyltransferase [Psychrobacter sp. Choline-02u-|tara:strand:+ start:2759 stop:5623 length:2865 start_codon:yes stop_codon:yes gene_type:complete